MKSRKIKDLLLGGLEAAGVLMLSSEHASLVLVLLVSTALVWLFEKAWEVPKLSLVQGLRILLVALLKLGVLQLTIGISQMYSPIM